MFDEKVLDIIHNSVKLRADSDDVLKAYGTSAVEAIEIGIIAEKRIGPILDLLTPTSVQVAHGILIGLTLHDYFEQRRDYGDT